MVFVKFNGRKPIDQSDLVFYLKDISFRMLNSIKFEVLDDALDDWPAKI
jgi:hypothetical protein